MQEGYGNDWDYAIRIEYAGTPLLEFDYMVDCETHEQFGSSALLNDALTVAADTLCSSFNITPSMFAAYPLLRAESRRPMVKGGFNGKDFATGAESGHFSATLPDLGPGTHCVLIRFFSDHGNSPEDGGEPSPGVDYQLGAAVVIDNLSLSPGFSANFTDPLPPEVSFINSGDTAVFGDWGRLHHGITDNDLCTRNTSCAWLSTDNTTPTIANISTMGFAPGGFVIRNWLDQVIVSPWVVIPNPNTANMTILTFREFGGNDYLTSRIARSWSVRAKVDAGGCVPDWPRIGSHWSALQTFSWETQRRDASNAVPPGSDRVQVRFRVADLRLLDGSETDPELFIPGPGPFIDRVRIGRIAVTAPIMEAGPVAMGQQIGGTRDLRYQAQDAFATEFDTERAGAGERYKPSLDRFGTCAFSCGYDIAPGRPFTIDTPSPGDSILVRVFSADAAQPVTSVEFYGAIVSGPHVGKAPPPHVVAASGFFTVTPDTVVDTRTNQKIEDLLFVDLDDDYFRGGDVLRYLWLAKDQGEELSSLPAGLTGDPTSVAQAEEDTGGLFEVNFLPAIDWDAGYLARIQADAYGKLEPTGPELANSSQSKSILYVNKVNFGRRAGLAHRTSFMYTLDKLGYSDDYDVFDVQGFGDTNNDLGSRAAIQQAQGYLLIVHDAGALSFVPLPDGRSDRFSKVDQAAWYQAWLAQANTSEAGEATLWLIGAKIVATVASHPLITTDMGVNFVAPVTACVNPQVTPVVSSYTWANTNTSPFDEDLQLNGGCPLPREYDQIAASGSANATHAFDCTPGVAGTEGASVIMNTNSTQKWNTIMMTFPWFDSVAFPGNEPSDEDELAKAILEGLIGGRSPSTDVGEVGTAPKRTFLYQNAPNPFNPVTDIQFDLAIKARAVLGVFDVSGRRVRTLVDAQMEAERHRVRWDGTDGDGRQVASGLYFYRLQAGSYIATRKMVVLR